MAFFGHPPLRAVVSGGLLGHRTSVPTFLFLVPVLDVLDWRPEAVAVHRLEARLDCVLRAGESGVGSRERGSALVRSKARAAAIGVF